MDIASDGELTRDGDSFVVRAFADPYVLSYDGVECENSNAAVTDRIYRKRFQNKRIITADRADEAKRILRNGEGNIVIGMTGYSNISDENCAAWGIRHGAYELACMDLLSAAIRSLYGEFSGVRIRLSHGASDMGVDRSVIAVARKEGLDHLGFSCPKFLLFVPDDDDPVYVLENQLSYSEAFVKNLDILLSVGGRIQALEHDMLAAIRYNKRLVLLNVLKAISSTGGPPARDGTGRIIDATAAFEQAILMNVSDRKESSDTYENLRNYLSDSVRHLGRQILPPDRAYGRWLR